MADNVGIDTGTDATVATDDIGGKHHQRVKITIGADGVNDGDVSSGNPMPVTGTVAVTGVATSAKQDAQTALLNTIDVSLNDIETAIEGTLTVAGTVTAEDGGGSLTVDDGGGTLSIDDGGGSLTVDGTVGVSGTVTVTDSQALTDNGGGFSDGTSKVFPVGYIFDEVAGTALTENDIGAGRINANRAQVHALEDGATRGRYATVTASNALKVDGSGVTQPVSGTITATSAGPDAHDAAVAGNPVLKGLYASSTAPTNVSANGDVVRAWGLLNGAQATVLTAAGALIGGDATNGLDVDVTRVSGTVTTGGVAAHDAAVSGNPVLNGAYASAAAPTNVSADGDVTRLWALRSGALCAQITAAGALVGGDATGGLHVQGAIAHDAVDSGNPSKIGGKARTALPTAVAASDRVDASADVFGRLLVAHATPDMQVSKAFNATTTQTGAAIWTPAAGKKVVLTCLVIGTYGTTAARVIIWFGASADTTYTAGTDQPVVLASFAPSATVKPGLVLPLPVPLAAITADHVLRITTDAGISIDVTVHGYEV